MSTFTAEEQEYFAAASLVRDACIDVTTKSAGYLEPYYEMKAAAVSLAKEVIKLRAIHARVLDGGAE